MVAVPGLTASVGSVAVDAAVEIIGLRKSYGDVEALRGIDLQVERGSVFGLLGPNGSGKTTLLRLLAGLAAPSGGELVVETSREQVGFVAHEPLVYRELTALENLRMYGRLYRVRDPERIGMLLERFGLWDARNDRVGDFSRGMQQRVALCRALLHSPSLLLLDEPYNGLDADGAALLDRELEELRPRGTFVVATHEPARVEHFASSRLALA